jgi:hypothetical protein
MNDELRGMSAIDFYKLLNYDIYQLGNIGLNKNEAVKYPYKLIRRNIIEKITDFGNKYYEHYIETPYGCLRSVRYRSLPIKYLVENIDDLKILINIWRDSEYVPDLDNCDETYERIKSLLSGYGIYIPIVNPSALQTLLEEDIGIENFYYMRQDYPREINELIELMHDRRCQEYKLIAKHMPFDSCITIENTSTTYISPDIYREISQKHMKDFVDIMHAEGKLGIIHMCGLVNDLLDDFIPTGLDGIHALTEPPVGNTFISHALDVLGDDLIIITGLDGTKVLNPDYSPELLISHMEEFVTERLKKANVIFCVGADGLDMPLDRFETVSDWFAQNGYPIK